MKRKNFPIFFLTAIFSLIFVSCSSEDDAYINDSSPEIKIVNGPGGGPHTFPTIPHTEGIMELNGIRWVKAPTVNTINPYYMAIMRSVEEEKQIIFYSPSLPAIADYNTHTLIVTSIYWEYGTIGEVKRFYQVNTYMYNLDITITNNSSPVKIPHTRNCVIIIPKIPEVATVNLRVMTVK